MKREAGSGKGQSSVVSIALAFVFGMLGNTNFVSDSGLQIGAAAAQAGYVDAPQVETITVYLPSHLPAKPGCSNPKALIENLRWMHINRAVERGVLVRAMENMDATTVRKAFRKGQSHNQSAAKSIDNCTDEEVIRYTHEATEKFMRISECNQKPHAKSATCKDFEENIHWSLIDSGGCVPFSQRRILAGLRASNETIQQRAARIRKGFKVAQYHNSEVWDSADFISDKLVVAIANRVVEKHGITGEMGSGYSDSNPFMKCSGEDAIKKNGGNFSPSNPHQL